MLMFDQIIIPHDKTFQSEEVYMAAFFRLINPNCKIIRSKNYKKYLEYASRISPPERPLIVADGVYTFYDAWKDYGRLLCPNDIGYDHVEKNFILKIKDGDVLDKSICALNKPDGDTQSSDMVSFMRAVNIVNMIMDGWIKTANDINRWTMAHTHAILEE